VKDMLGNELLQGDTIHIKVGNEWILGHVVKTQLGGIAVTGIPRDKNGQVGVTPDMIVFQAAIGFLEPPGSPHPGVLKIDAPKDAGKIIDTSLKM
jgi:hypothetical protein